MPILYLEIYILWMQITPYNKLYLDKLEKEKDKIKKNLLEHDHLILNIGKKINLLLTQSLNYHKLLMNSNQKDFTVFGPSLKT